MSPDDPTRKTDDLGELLRRADPAAETPGLPAEDARVIRRRMLEEADTRLPVLPFRPAWAAVAVLLLLAMVWIWRTGEHSAPRPPETPIRVTETPRDSSPSPTPSVVPEAPEPPGETSPPQTAAARRPPTVEASEDPIAEKRTSRQVQMQAPGGTRIVWVLDPDLTL